MVEINDILCRILQIEHGFQHIIDGADQIFSAYSKEQCLNFAFEWFKSKDYQVRMLATTMLGKLANENNNALYFLKLRGRRKMTPSMFSYGYSTYKRPTSNGKRF